MSNSTFSRNSLLDTLKFVSRQETEPCRDEIEATLHARDGEEIPCRSFEFSPCGLELCTDKNVT